MTDLPHECILTIGDWSKDGHNMSDLFRYRCSHSLADQRAGYWAARELTGLNFYHGDHGDPHNVCARYQDGVVSGFHVEMLRRRTNYTCTKFGDHGPRGFRPRETEFAEFFLWFLGVTLPGFEVSPLVKTAGPDFSKENCDWLERHQSILLNAWWSNDFNLSPGYGIYCQGLAHLREMPSPKNRHVPDRPKVEFWSSERAAYRYMELGDFEHDCKMSVEEAALFDPYDDRKRLRGRERVSAWCRENVEGNLVVVHHRVFFNNEKDAVRFKLGDCSFG